MEKEERFFGKLSDNRIYQVIFFVVCMSFVLGLYGILHIVIEKEASREYKITKDKSIVKYIEDVQIIKGEVILSGWCFYNGLDSDEDRIQLFLRNIENGEDVIWLDVEEVLREDVNEYFKCEYDYQYTGFEAKGKLKKIDIDAKVYEIFLKLSHTQEVISQVDGREETIVKEYAKTVSTNRYLNKGELVAKKSSDEPLRTASQVLNEVFEKGKLLTYQEDFDMYVYQHQGNVYWVVGEDAPFVEDEANRIPFQLETTRVDLLPENRREKGLKYDNLGFVFEEMELQGEEFFPYRVAKCKIPMTYPITSIRTGYYLDGQWLWSEDLSFDIREFVQ